MNHTKLLEKQEKVEESRQYFKEQLHKLNEDKALKQKEHLDAVVKDKEKWKERVLSKHRERWE